VQFEADVAVLGFDSGGFHGNISPQFSVVSF